jgi:hypothetical protein
VREREREKEKGRESEREGERKVEEESSSNIRLPKPKDQGPYSQHFIFSVAYAWAQYARVFVPCRIFQPSLMFARQAKAYPCSTLR